jgi:hypothetical protein
MLIPGKRQTVNITLLLILGRRKNKLVQVEPRH